MGKDQYYEFDCGCKFKMLDDKAKEVDGLPPIEVDFYNLRMCPHVWEIFDNGSTKGVFQLESQLGQEWSSKVKPRDVDDLAVISSIIRPGTLENSIDDKNMAQHYVDRRHGKDKAVPPHPALENAYKDTFGVGVYQEQSIQVVKEVAGFTESESEKFRKCLTKDSIFITPTGPRSIEDLYKSRSKKVLSLDPVTGKNIFVPLNSVTYSGKKRVIRIRTEMGETICGTYDHRVYTDKGWKELKDITTDDHVLINQKADIKGGKNYTPEMMRLFGYFISEGCSSNGDVKITNSDEYILNDIKSILKNLNEDYRITTHKNNVKDIHLTGKLKGEFLQIFGKNKSRNKLLPNKILSCDKELLKNFIGAYFSGDGYVSKNGLIGISSTSKEIILKLQAILITFGLNFSFRKRSSTYNECVYHSYEITSGNYLTVSRFAKKFADKICPNKRKKLTKVRQTNGTSQQYHIPSSIIKKVSKNNSICDLEQKLITGSIYNRNMSYDKADYINSMIESELLEFFINCDAKFSKIRSVTKEGKQEVYDFEVNSNNHFAYVNNVLVHNSVGKKLVDVMAELKPKFIEGCINNGLTEEEAEMIFEILKKGERYSFNRSVCEDTFVQTEEGHTKKITDVNIGDLIKAPDSDGQDVFVEVINKYDHGEQEVFEITLESERSIKCTLLHKFLCSDGYVRPLYEIISNDYEIVTESV